MSSKRLTILTIKTTNIMTRLTLAPELETYLYNLVDGTIEHVIFCRDFIIVSTNIDNYKIYYNEIK